MLKFQDNPHLSHHLVYHRYNEGDDEDIYPKANEAENATLSFSVLKVRMFF